MGQTANYGLNQWDKSDRIMMEDFNADNAKVDAALAEQAAAIALCGNCKIVYGSYTGTGTCGADNPNTLVFDGKPLFVLIKPSTSGSYDLPIIGIWGVQESVTHVQLSGSSNTLIWGAQSLSWYSESSSYQLNSQGRPYYYIALLAADEA